MNNNFVSSKVFSAKEGAGYCGTLPWAVIIHEAFVDLFCCKPKGGGKGGSSYLSLRDGDNEYFAELVQKALKWSSLSQIIGADFEGSPSPHSLRNKLPFFLVFLNANSTGDNGRPQCLEFHYRAFYNAPKYLYCGHLIVIFSLTFYMHTFCLNRIIM